jgi:hypothetical protein
VRIIVLLGNVYKYIRHRMRELGRNRDIHPNTLNWSKTVMYVESLIMAGPSEVSSTIQKKACTYDNQTSSWKGIAYLSEEMKKGDERTLPRNS